MSANLEYKGEVHPPVNVLADRYASPEMVANFSTEAKVFMERGLWIEVMTQQADLGLDIDQDAIDAYKAVQGDINLKSMRNREKVTHHDVKARIEEFNDLADHQLIHLGMTSRDLTENIEQFQIVQGLRIVRTHAISALGGFAQNAAEYSLLPMAGRSHNVAAQATTMGKRFANSGEELIGGVTRIDALLSTYALRGLKGPVGTQQDLLDLFEGDASKVQELELRIARSLGFNAVLGSVGQIYPRSMDYDVVTALKQSSLGPSNFANAVRLMAGTELVTEGFKPGQVGSSAMPHKKNAAKSERISSLSALLSGPPAVLSEVAGNQWNEGDVSCSAARRVAIADAFYAADAVMQTTSAVLEGFGAYPAMVHGELNRYMPYLTTSRVLMAAAKAGIGREDAHEIIKEHAVAEALEMSETGRTENRLFHRLAEDERMPVGPEALQDAASKPLELTGLAVPQVEAFVSHVEKLLADNPEAATYRAADVL